MEKTIPVSTIIELIRGISQIACEMNDTSDQLRLQDYLIMAMSNLIVELTSENN